MNTITTTISRFCEMIGIGKTKTYELINDGSLETIKLGRRRLILMRSVRKLISASAETGEK